MWFDSVCGLAWKHSSRLKYKVHNSIEQFTYKDRRNKNSDNFVGWFLLIAQLIVCWLSCFTTFMRYFYFKLNILVELSSFYTWIPESSLLLIKNFPLFNLIDPFRNWFLIFGPINLRGHNWIRHDNRMTCTMYVQCVLQKSYVKTLGIARHTFFSIFLAIVFFADGYCCSQNKLIDNCSKIRRNKFIPKDIRQVTFF